MERIPGTAEKLIHNASFYLRPLFAALDDANGIQAFLEIELDVDLPNGSFQSSALSNDINQSKAALVALFTIADELRSAFEADDVTTIVQKGAEAIQQIKNIAEAVKHLRDSARLVSETFSDPLASQLKDYCEQLFERIAMLLAMIYTDNYLLRLDTMQLMGLADLEDVTFGAPTFPKTVKQEKIYF